MPKENLTIEQWQRLVHAVLHTHFRHIWNQSRGRRVIAYMDLFQEGILGLEEALSRFNEDHDSGAAFSTYAWRCVYTTVANYVDQNITPITTSRWRSVQDGSDTLKERHQAATGCRFFTELKPVGQDDWSEFEDGLPDPESGLNVQQIERKDLLRVAIARLRETFGDPNVDMLLAYFGGATYDELGKKAGTSYETIRKRINRLKIAAFGLLSDMEDDLYATYASSE